MTGSDSLRTAAYTWLRGDAVPDWCDVEVIDMPSGFGAARRTGLAHRFADGVTLRVDGEHRTVAVWICGATTVDAIALPNGDEDQRCLTCDLAVTLPAGPSVYRAFNIHGVLLYVGSTTNPPQRIRGHMTTTRWWPEVVRIDMEPYATEQQARRAEAEAIRDQPGIYNREFVRRPKTFDSALGGITVTVSNPQRRSA